MNPREEARQRLGGGYDPRVLEPSPPAVTEPPWFADDPVAVDDRRELPVVAPVTGADLTWDELVTHGAPRPPDPFWNDAAFGGAGLPFAALTTAPDPRDAALAFLRKGRRVLDDA